MLQSLSSLQDVQKIYDWFAEMRKDQPVWLDKSSSCWHVFRYEDVMEVITDHSLFSSKRPRALARPPFTNRASTAPSLIAMDPPQHRMYRNLVSSSFTPQALAPLARRIRDIVQELLDEVRLIGQMDIVADLAYPLPTTVIAELLGVPATDRPRFKRWADALLSRQLSDAEIFNSTEIEKLPGFRQANQAMDEMAIYFEEMLEKRRRSPRHDLMSRLLTAEIEGERLSQTEMVSFCVLLLLAGHVTTTNLLEQAILCFDTHPAAMQQLTEQPELMAGAVEEVLRYASPVWRVTRVNTEEVIIDGVSIPPHSIIFAWLASANRDSAQFTYPEKFDITRSPNPHVAFGHGVHFCLGAPLARLEASIALPMMLEQLPQLRRVSEIPLELLDSRVLFGVKHLPVTFAVSPSYKRR
ncbi:MAG TPA: cytochrome P450 [Ktedonobacteraceae bacterium]|nr:cytochrome P450 [Ktedonobacteraceae bacterium]